MADFFTSGIPISKEEQDFKIAQRIAGQTDTRKAVDWKNVGQNVFVNFPKSVHNFMTRGDTAATDMYELNNMGIDLPTYDQIRAMNANDLLALKNDLNSKKNKAASTTFQTAYQIAINNIDKELLNKKDAATSNKIVSSVNSVSTANDAELLNANIEDTSEENAEIQHASAEKINGEASEVLNIFNTAATESEAITSASEFKDSESVEQVNVLADSSLINEKNASNLAKHEFEQGKGEINLEKKAANKEVTEEDTKSAVELIKDELMKVMPADELPADLLLLKFGANLLRARSNRRGALPKFLDELGQSMEPVTDLLIAYDMKKKEQDRALALEAYGIYEKQQDRLADKYEYQDLFNVYAADYDQKGSGILQGGTTLIGQVTTPAEMDYYKSIRYPDANSVEAKLHTEEQLADTPKHLQGLPMFVMTKTTGQKQDFGSPVFSGYGAGDPTAIRTAFEFAGFLEDGIRNDVKMYQMITMGMAEGMKPIAGPGAKFGRWTQVTAQKLNTIAKFFGVDSGIPLANKLAGEDDYKKFYAAMGAAGIDISPEAIKGSIRSDIDKMYAYNDALLSSDSPDALSQEEWAYNNDQIKVLDQMSQELQQRDDLNVIVSLMQKSAFTRARYLQGTNRLLKDVIGEARKIMDVMGKGEREALAILSENLSSYQRKYKEQLGIIWNPKTDMDKISSRSITIDKDFNVTGGLSAYDIGNISDDSPILGSHMNLNDPSVQNQIGNQTQFNSLEEQLNSFGIEMPKGFK